MTLTPTPGPGPQPGVPADVDYWPVAPPNPDPDVLDQQREAQHRQRLAQLSSGAHPSRTSDRHEGAASGSALAAPTNVVPSTDHAVVAVSPAFTVTRGERREPPPGAQKQAWLPAGAHTTPAPAGVPQLRHPRRHRARFSR